MSPEGMRGTSVSTFQKRLPFQKKSAMQSASYDARDIYNFYGITICYVINKCILIRKSAAVIPSLNSRASTALSGGMRWIRFLPLSQEVGSRCARDPMARVKMDDASLEPSSGETQTLHTWAIH